MLRVAYDINTGIIKLCNTILNNFDIVNVTGNTSNNNNNNNNNKSNVWIFGAIVFTLEFLTQ
jgi:hypothetical protein